ncbi:hypothetical protein L226DRAFT_564820 [Lentinus tigrinus ALCF2SS1-7]|uniref:Uncharacterized protein n=1 Tax=Lentinus tigrinus ALCF2SS1-6 TaxID=1328759 RepID=A0A5C2SPV7_9APHY|nr:hypothetical protein L227DRAFT_571568 [Lentinus tigrinus ALCF2SS1-6]RPD82218.1 hypothetical protein L226DRAFT_564820 [Lentinus tigrinus ALCF2SS1-7]
MALPPLIVSRAPSLILFTTLEAGLAFFVYTQWKKPSLIAGPLPSAIPKGYIGRARFGPHEVQPVHVAQTLGHAH